MVYDVQCMCIYIYIMCIYTLKNLIEITRDAKRCWCILLEDNDRAKVLAKTTGR